MALPAPEEGMMPEPTTWTRHGVQGRDTLREACGAAKALWELRDPDHPALRWRGRIEFLRPEGYYAVHIEYRYVG